MKLSKKEILIDLGDPKIGRESTSKPIFSDYIYSVKFLPNFAVKLIYFNSNDQRLPEIISNIKIKPFIFLEYLERKPNENFRFLILFQDYCFIISIISSYPPLFLYLFIKSTSSTAVVFSDERSQKLIEDYFHYKFIHYQYFLDNTVIHNFFHHFQNNKKYSEYFNCVCNEDIDVKFSIYEAISQAISPSFAYFIIRHEFFKYTIKISDDIDFSTDYLSIYKFYKDDDYEIEVVFHKIANMLFLYKHFIGTNKYNDCFNERKYAEQKIFNPILDYLGICKTQNKKNFCIIYEYVPLYELNNNYSYITIESCFYSILKHLDCIHSKGYSIEQINTKTVLLTADNSVFLCNYHQVTEINCNFSKNLYQLGRMIQSFDIENKYLKELALLPEDYFKGKKPKDYYICYPVTQYFIIRMNPLNYFKTRREIIENEISNFEKDEDDDLYDFSFNKDRRDNKILFDVKHKNDIGVLKTLLFCYSNTEHSIDQFLKDLPDVNENSNIYISFGKEMLDFNLEKGIQILNIVINSNSIPQREKALYIIGKHYFFMKNYQKTQEYFRQIENNGKAFYIIGRMYQLQLISVNMEESYNSKKYYEQSMSFEYWRAYYQEGLRLMTAKNYKEAFDYFQKALFLSFEDNEDDVAFFGLLGDDYKYTYGLVLYNIAICYQKMGDFENMIINFDLAREYDCKLAYAPLAYINMIRNKSYMKSYQLLQEALKYLPLNFELIINTNFQILNYLLDTAHAEEARKFLDIAIRLNADSQGCNENAKNLLIKNIQFYSIITANQFNSQGLFFDAFPLYALAAAFNSPAGFIGLATSFLFGRGIEKNILNSLICLKVFFSLFSLRDESDNKIFIDVVDEHIKKYPVYMQRTSYFKVGDVLFRASKSPYIPFDFLIKAASLVDPEAEISDVKYISSLNVKISVIIESIINHYQYVVQQNENQIVNN